MIDTDLIIKTIQDGLKNNKMTHGDMICFLIAMGLKTNTDGVCNGITTLWLIDVNSILVENDNYVGLSKCLEYLSNSYYNAKRKKLDTKLLKTNMLEKEQKISTKNNLIDIEALANHMAINQDPDRANCFNSYKNQTHKNSIYEIVSKAKKSFDLKFSLIGVFTGTDKYFTKFIREIPIGVTYEVSTPTHIMAFYKVGKDRFIFFDSNSFYNSKQYIKTYECQLDYIIDTINHYTKSPINGSEQLVTIEMITNHINISQANSCIDKILSVPDYSNDTLYEILQASLKYEDSPLPEILINDIPHDYLNDKYLEILKKACRFNQVAIVRKVLNKIKNPFEMPDKLWNGLQAACAKGNIKIVKLFKEKYGIEEFKTKTNDGDNCFLLACGSGNLKLVKYILESSTDEQKIQFLQSTNNIQNNCFHEAAKYNKHGIFKYLFELKTKFKEASIDNAKILKKRNSVGLTPFLYACRANNLPMAMYILKRYPEAITDKCDNMANAVHHACAKGTPQLVDFIVEQASYELMMKEPEKKVICIRYAASNGNVTILSHLELKYGFNYSIDSKYTATALNYACMASNIPVLDFFYDKLGKKAFLNNKSAIEESLQTGKIEVIKHLVKLCGKNILKTTQNPILLACEQDNPKTLEYLLTTFGKAAFNLHDKDNDPLIIMNVKLSNIDNVKFLVKHFGRKILERTDKNGATTLEIAIKHAKPVIANYILNSHENFDEIRSIANRNKFNIVNSAILSNDELMLKSVLDNAGFLMPELELDINNKITILEYACRMGTTKMFDQLFSRFNIDIKLYENRIYLAYSSTNTNDHNMFKHMVNKYSLTIPMFKLDIIMLFMNLIKHDNVNAIKMLYDGKPSINPYNYDSFYPLIWAARHGSINVAIYLSILPGYDVNEKNDDCDENCNALSKSIICENFEFTKHLLSQTGLETTALTDAINEVISKNKTMILQAIIMRNTFEENILQNCIKSQVKQFVDIMLKAEYFEAVLKMYNSFKDEETKAKLRKFIYEYSTNKNTLARFFVTFKDILEDDIIRKIIARHSSAPSTLIAIVSDEKYKRYFNQNITYKIFIEVIKQNMTGDLINILKIHSAVFENKFATCSSNSFRGSLSNVNYKTLIALYKHFERNINIAELGNAQLSMLLIYAMKTKNKILFNKVIKLRKHDSKFTKGKKENSLLLYAAKSNSNKFLNAILAKDVDINHFNILGETALSIASYNANPKMVQTLLNCKDIKTTPPSDITGARSGYAIARHAMLGLIEESPSKYKKHKKIRALLEQHQTKKDEQKPAAAGEIKP